MAKGYVNYIEGVVEILVGIFLCFWGRPMLKFTVKILLFAGITAGLYLGF